MAVVLVLSLSTLGAGIVPNVALFPTAPTTAGGSGGPPSGGATPTPDAAAVPTLTVTPSSAPVGTQVEFTATAFSDSSSITIKTPAGTDACLGTTGTKGNYTCAYLIPAGPGGAESFSAADTHSHTASVTFTVTSNVVASPAAGLVGTPVFFLGTGFGGAISGETGKFYEVNLTWVEPSGAVQSVCLVETDSSGNGTFGCSFTLPAAPAGDHLFHAAAVGLSLNASVEFRVLPGLTVGPSYGPVGTAETFTGTGFGANVEVYVNWTEGQACEGESLASGSFSCSYAIPFGTPGGTYTFVASQGTNSASTSFVVSFLEVSPSSATVGTTLTFTAGGFLPETLLTISWQDGAVCPGNSTTASGTLTCTYVLPPTPAGPYTVTATDGQGDIASAVLSVEPLLVANVTYGDPGTDVELVGSGFGGSVSVNVTWSPGGVPTVICPTLTSSLGSFSCPYVIPKGTAGGAYPFVATDADADRASATFTVTYLTATPATGPNGTSVTLQGGGFAPGKSFVVSWRGSDLTCAKSTVAANGTVSCALTLGYAPGGSAPFRASDAAGDVATAAFTVATNLTATPTRGLVAGENVTFAATGFAASTLVQVTWVSNGTVACSGTTSSLGSTNCTVKAPPLPVGSYAVVAADNVSDVAGTVVHVVPRLVVTPTGGIGGTSIRFFGTGFDPTSAFSIASSLGVACNGTSTLANGSLSCGYIVPAAPSGSYTFRATDAQANGASATFVIGPFLNLSARRGPVGTYLTFTGTGFAAGHVANVSWSDGLACSTTIGASGTFTCAFSIPATPFGNYTFLATDAPTGKKGDDASATFTVLPSLTLHGPVEAVGSNVTVVGEGFVANETVSVTWSEGLACSGSSNSLGTFDCSFTVPATPAGPHILSATAAGPYAANATLTVVPQLTLTPSVAPVGTGLTVNGTGFAASVEVNVSWEYGTVCLRATSSVGSFSCPFVVPATPAGTYGFRAAIAGVTVTTANLTVVPSLTLAPVSGAVGTSVTFRANGFGAGASITIDSSTLGATCGGTVAANGSFACTYVIPSTPDGLYAFNATDNQSNVAHATFSVGTTLTVTPTSGIVGSSISFLGHGFAASSPMKIVLGGTTVCAGSTDAEGDLACATTVPAAVLGAQTFVATAGPSAAATFQVLPALAVSPSSGGDGSQPSFTGTGFPAAVAIVVSWSGATTCSATANATGGFGCSLSIPAGTAAGTYTFTARDLAGDNASATFRVVTGLVISPAYGPLPSRITITGSNFPTGSPFNVTWESGVVACSGTTNGTGGFVCTYTVPTGTANGTYTFTATAGSTTASAIFVVTYLVADPTGLVDGAPVTLIGGGFTPSSGYTVTAPWGSVCTGATTPAGAFSCRTTVPASEAAGEYHFSANDSHGDVANASFGILSVTTPTANRSSADVGQDVAFSEAAYGGAGVTLTFVWHALPPGCASTAPNFTCRPSGAQDLPISVTVTDAGGFSVTTAALSFAVFVDPTQAPPMSSEGTADLGGRVTFTANVSGGSGGGTYVWTAASGLNCTASTGPTLSCVPDATGTFAVSYAWTDSNGVAATGTTSLEVTVNADPTQAPPKPSTSAADVGESVTFTAEGSGGSGGGAYVWTAASGLNCTASTGPTLSCVPDATGTFAVSYVWTDSDGLVAKGSTTLEYEVGSPPTIGTPSANVTSADVGESVTFTEKATGGAGTLSYAWHGLPTGCAGTTATIVCAPDAAVVGATITVTVGDENGYNATSGTLVFTVFGMPTVAPPMANRTAIDVGQTVTFTASGAGGAGQYTYAWTAPAGLTCTATDGPELNCTAAASGNFAVSVSVRDMDGGVSTVATSAPEAVSALPSVTALTASRTSADIGQKLTFTATYTAGSGHDKLTWTVSPSTGLGCAASTTAVLSCTPTAAGSYTVEVVVTDGNGGSSPARSVAAYTIDTLPAATLTVSPSSLLEGHAVTFTAVVTGGAGKLVYNWTGLPGGCTATNQTLVLTCKPSGSGSFLVVFTITDANKGSGAANTTLDVRAAFLGLPALEGEAIVAGAVLGSLAALVTFLALRSHRRRKSQQQLQF